MGSIHTEMAALLEDRGSPLYRLALANVLMDGRSDWRCDRKHA